MDKRNKNIEDFFNKSLEQFSEVPSDRVWAGIAQDLEKEKTPFYKKWPFWIKSFLFTGLLLLLSWGYYSTQQAIHLLTTKTNQLEATNQELKLALKECSIENQGTVSAQEVEQMSAQLAAAQSLIANQTANSNTTSKKSNNSLAGKEELRLNYTPLVAWNSTNRFYTTNNQLVHNHSFFGMNKKGNLNFASTQDLFSDASFRKKIRVSSTKEGMETKEDTALQSKLNLDSPLSVAAITAYKAKNFQPLTKLGATSIGAMRVKTKFRRNLPSSLMEYTAFNLTQPVKRKLDYRFGFSFGGMNTFTDKNDQIGLGYNSGITNELQLFKKLYLTAGLHYISQNYEIKLNAENQDVLLDYPVGPLDNIVTSINQHAQYIEVPLGLKWYSKENAKGMRFYVNPAVSWQFYFPQKFVYEQVTNRGIIPFGDINDQYFGYFGTMQLQVGIEESFFKNRKYQIGLWGEKSFIPIGVENRSLFNLGIRGAVFFK